MHRFMLLFALCLILVASAGFAQEQRGAIEGTVKDSTGGLMPGVTIEARSPSLVGVTTTTSGDDGSYRFPSLAPGVYVVTAQLQGFATWKAEGVRLELGQVLKVEISLHVASLAENVEVTAETPIIDVKQNSAGAHIDSAVIDRIPKGRDFTSVLTVAPSIDNESARNFGIQIDGASGADNRFFIDGVDHTDMQRGTSLSINSTGKAIANDFLEQVEVKASGYNAEYRAAIGGVVSAVTRSGSNQWHGSVGGYFTSDRLQGSVRPTLQLNPNNQTIAEYVIAPPDKFKNWEGVFDVSGPVLRDRLWFYAGFNPQQTATDRTVIFRSNQGLGPQTYNSTPVDKIGTLNLTGQIAKNLRGKFALTNERVRGGLTLPNIQTDGTSTSNPSLFPAPTRTDRFKDSYSGVLDWVATPRTFVDLTTSFLSYGGKDVGTFSSALRHTFSGSNFQFSEIPASLQNVTGYADFPASTRMVRDTFHRYTANADVTQYVSWHGSHTLKGGIQLEHIANNVLSGQQAPTITLNWDAAYVTIDGARVRGKYGYYVDSRSYTQGDVAANNTSVFGQDAWTVNRKLTLNLGLRAENEHVPSYRPENPSVYFGFGSKLAPRLGFAYDVKDNSRWKVYGSWGMYYDVLKLTIGRVMFGADRWVNYYYTLDTYDWPSITCDYPPPPSGNGCPGTYIAQFDNRSVANDPSFNLVDPNLRPTQTEEFTFGTDHEVNETMSFGVRYVRKWADYVIEAVCQFVPAGEACGVNNPGFGTIGKHPFTDGPDQPIAKRVYNGLEFRLRKQYAHRWLLDASYLRSRLWGNWSGVGSSDEAVNCLQANSCLAFNFLYYSYDAHGKPTYGVLGTDRPDQFKVSGTYDLKWGTMLGVNQLAQSGIPQSTIIKERTDGINFFPYGRGDLGRTPFYTQTDLLVQQRIPLGERARLLVGANIINLFDQDIVTLQST